MRLTISRSSAWTPVPQKLESAVCSSRCAGMSAEASAIGAGHGSDEGGGRRFERTLVAAQFDGEVGFEVDRVSRTRLADN